MEELNLIPLPCSCAVEAKTVRQHEHRSVLECPWCGATFTTQQFAEWLFAGVPRPVFLELGPMDLLTYEGKFLEVVAKCGCGDLIVRERNGKSQKEFHLEADPKDIEVLRN